MKYAVEEQERIGIDVLVHGEPERTDMVEYFGQKLEGFTFTDNGWVQSYGSRYVRPPIIHGEYCSFLFCCLRGWRERKKNSRVISTVFFSVCLCYWENVLGLFFL